jgi:hypothetical protein
MDVGAVRAGCRVLAFSALDHVPKPRRLSARDAGEMAEDGVRELDEGGLVKELPAPAARASSRVLFRQGAPETQALQTLPRSRDGIAMLYLNA